MSDAKVLVKVTHYTTPYGGIPDDVLTLTEDRALELVEAGWAVLIPSEDEVSQPPIPVSIASFDDEEDDDVD